MAGSKSGRPAAGEMTMHASPSCGGIGFRLFASCTVAPVERWHTEPASPTSMRVTSACVLLPGRRTQQFANAGTRKPRGIDAGRAGGEAPAARGAEEDCKDPDVAEVGGCASLTAELAEPSDACSEDDTAALDEAAAAGAEALIAAAEVAAAGGETEVVGPDVAGACSAGCDDA